jgi:hypothetical protein
MHVFNGDVIVPLKGKSVTLIYRHTDCGEKQITQRTVVKCDPREFSTPGGFLNLLPDAMKDILNSKPRHEGAEEESGSEDYEPPCFPSDFPFALWPPEKSTVLHGEPVLFRWANFPGRILPCSQVDLLIAPSDFTGDSGDCVAKEMKAGELIWVIAPFREKTAYQWHVEKQGKKISKNYHFSILGKKESENIVAQMSAVAKQYEDPCPGLRQALYLQIITEAVPGLDLYADTFRLMQEYKDCQRNRE